MRLAVMLGWLCLVSRFVGSGQSLDYREKYRVLLRQQQLSEATAVVAQWEKNQPQDPDVYVAKFNLLLRAAERPAGMGTPAPGYVKSTGRGVTVGDEIKNYDPASVQEAIVVLRKALGLAPDRLDIRFGMAKATEYIGDAAQQYQVLSEALAWRQSAQGKPWRWQDGKALPEAEAQFVPSAVEEYIGPYWSSVGQPDDQSNSVRVAIGPDRADAVHQASCRRGLALADLLVKYYPQSSLGYFNRALYYSLVHDEPQALTQFIQADQRQPNDPQTIANLTRLSLNLGDRAATKGYLARLRKYPDFKADCQQFAAELRKL